MPTLSIIVPCYNETNTIHKILDAVRAVHLIGQLQKEIIVVVDCSKDDSYLVTKKYFENLSDVKFQIVKHEVNKGKGAALRTGFEYATGDYYKIKINCHYSP